MCIVYVCVCLSVCVCERVCGCMNMCECLWVLPVCTRECVYERQIESERDRGYVREGEYCGSAPGAKCRDMSLCGDMT